MNLIEFGTISHIKKGKKTITTNGQASRWLYALCGYRSF